jgi:hypothetical protein
VKRIFVVTVGLAATFGLLSSCSDSPKLGLPTDQTLPDNAGDATLPDLSLPDVTLPDLSLPDLSLPDLSLPDLSLPDLSDISIPTDFTIPQETIDLMISQFEAAGLKVDRACFQDLLSDESLRKLVEAGQNGSPSPEVIQKFLSCITP